MSDPLRVRFVWAVRVMLPPVPVPVGEVVIAPTVMLPAVGVIELPAVIETAPPLWLVPEPEVLIAPLTTTLVLAAVRVRLKPSVTLVPVIVPGLWKVSVPVPLWVKVVFPVRVTGPLNVAVVPPLVALVPVIEMVAAVTVRAPAVGPSVVLFMVKVPVVAVRLWLPLPLVRLPLRLRLV